MKFRDHLLLALASICMVNAFAQSNSLGLPTQFNLANAPFLATLSYQGLTFTVRSPNKGMGNAVSITAQGLQADAEPIQVPAQGKVTGAQIADLNNDGYPEIYIYINTDDVDARGSIVAYASNGNKTITPIYLPPLAEDPKLLIGYTGHDEFSVVENSLERRFPISGLMNQSYRQVQYKLKAGEAGWKLVKTRISEF
jgi:hypothetical protein